MQNLLWNSSWVQRVPVLTAASSVSRFERFVQIEHHHGAGFEGDAEGVDLADPCGPADSYPSSHRRYHQPSSHGIAGGGITWAES